MRLPVAPGAGGAAGMVATVRLETPAPDEPRGSHVPFASASPRRPSGGTTFSATVGESVSLPARRPRALAWALGGAAAALGAAALYLALDSSRRPERSSAATAVPVSVPAPSLPPRPLPAPPPPAEPAPSPEVAEPDVSQPARGQAREPVAAPARRPHRRRSTGQPARAERAPEPAPAKPAATPKKRLDAIEDI